MSQDTVQAKYDQLDAIAQRFAQQANQIQQMRQRIDTAAANLQNGGWEGRGSQAFFSEMETVTRPATARLQAALLEASRVTLEIIQIMQEAEQEAASVFKGDHSGNRSKAADGAGPGGAAPSGQNGAVNDPSELFNGAYGFAAGAATMAPTSQPLTVRNPHEMFSEPYMEGLIGSRFRGDNTPELNRLMEDLYRAGPNNTPEVRSILNRLADLRGVDREAFYAQYQKYLQLYANAHRIGGTLPNIDLDKHGDFLGTTVSLRYGKVVGDTFGIDPVFGSLLNPTGGLVGSANESYQPSANDAVGYHGVVHDAAGYLLNSHGIGPGYDYLNRDFQSTTSPLSGQVGGISWWMSHAELEVDVLPHLVPDVPFVPRFIEYGVADRVEGLLVAPIRVGTSVYEGGSTIVDGVGDVFSGDFARGGGNIAKGAGTIIKGVGRSIIDLFD